MSGNKMSVQPTFIASQADIYDVGDSVLHNCDLAIQICIILFYAIIFIDNF